MARLYSDIFIAGGPRVRLTYPDATREGLSPMADPNQFLALTETLRDILLIVSTVALLVLTGFMAYVGWQLYRLGRELYLELKPILASLQGTSDSVRSVTAFVNHQMVSPARGALSLGISARGIWQVGAEVVRALRAGKAGGGTV